MDDDTKTKGGSRRMTPAKIDAAIVACLDYAAESKMPPTKTTASFLRQLLYDPAWTPEEVEAVTFAVAKILRGLAEAQGASPSR